MRNKRKSLKGDPWLMLTPALAVIALLFSGGLALAILQSVGYFAPHGESGFTVKHYAELLGDREFYASLLLTLKLTAVSTLLSAVFGLGMALGLRKIAGRSKFINLMLQIPLSIPHLLMAGTVINLVAPSGLMARAAFALGLIQLPTQFPALINDRYGAGIVITYVLKETPFIALMILALFARIGDEYEEAARTLGASAWQRFRYVTLPLIAPAVVSSSLVVFAFILGAFEIPYLLGRPYPVMLSVLAQRRFQDSDLAVRPGAMAIAVIGALLTVFLVWGYLRLSRVLIGVERPSI